MKITIYVIIITVGIIFIISSCTKKSEVKNTEDKDSQNQVVEQKENPFIELREKAFQISPKELGLTFSNEETKVFGIIMDWEMDGATATTVSFITGDASLYLSSGGGVIGGGTHQNVKIAAEKFVEQAQSFLAKAKKTESNKLPETNYVNFYLLTNKGTYVGMENIENFDNNSSEWLPLFDQGNRVLSELRNISEN